MRYFCLGCEKEQEGCKNTSLLRSMITPPQSVSAVIHPVFPRVLRPQENHFIQDPHEPRDCCGEPLNRPLSQVFCTRRIFVQSTAWALKAKHIPYKLPCHRPDSVPYQGRLRFSISTCCLLLRRSVYRYRQRRRAAATPWAALKQE